MSVHASEVAAFLGHCLTGPDIAVDGLSSIDRMASGSLIFAVAYKPELRDRINATADLLALVCPEYDGRLTASHIITDRPRLDFARAAEHFFTPARRTGVASSAIVAPTARLGAGVSIGNYCVIGENVSIGARTEIRDHVIIRDNCVIGSGCLIKSHTVIGEEGFGFEFDESGTPIRIPHYGNVIIGNDVEIGALNVVARATLDSTVIGNGVKTDEQTLVAHNSFIGDNTMLFANVVICGSVRVGRNVLVAPQAVVIQKVEIGDNAMVGMGAVVTKSVETGMVVVGNPAKVLRPR